MAVDSASNGVQANGAQVDAGRDGTIATPEWTRRAALSPPRVDVAGAAAPDGQRSWLTGVFDGRGWTVAQVVIDGLTLSVAVAVTLRWPGTPVPLHHGAGLLLVPPLVMALMATRRAYERRLRVTFLDGGRPVVWAVSVSILAIVMGETYVARAALEPGVLMHAWVLSILLVHAGHLAAALGQRWARTRSVVATPTLIVGGGVVARKIAERLMSDRQYGLRPIGFLDVEASPAASLATGLPVLGRPSDLEAVAHVTGAHHVVLAFSSTADRAFVPLLRRTKRANMEVSLVPRMFESMNDRVSYEAFGGIPVLGLRGTDPLGWRFTVKHALDRVLAALLLLLTAPVMLALAALVRLSSPGPALFTQPRVGRDGQVFDVLKFRSMRCESAPPDQHFEPRAGTAPGGVEGLDRRTRIGRLMRRTSLDELPQLINVLKGDMSLVGPRPERIEYVEKFRRDIERYGDRDRVKAGITGWAQVHGLRGQTSIADRAEWDNFYIENWSLRLDLRILAMTVLAACRSTED
jgi:exopolysaccharide biosynthesis polyprenyl glycosylphosphotransferase